MAQVETSGTSEGISWSQARELAEAWEREANSLIVKARQGSPNEIAGQLGEASGWHLAAYQLREAAGLLPQPEAVEYNERH